MTKLSRLEPEGSGEHISLSAELRIRTKLETIKYVLLTKVRK